MRAPTTEVDIEAAIRDAQRKLDKFERSASGASVLYRLRLASPLHPFLVIRALGLFAAIMLVLFAGAALVGPLVSDEAAEVLAHLDGSAGLPLFAVLAVLVVCMFGVGAGAHFAAIAAGRSAPLLPHEARQHQRLVADLRQLEAQRAVQQRISPHGAEPRIVPPSRRG
jgi:hypothetical protein